MSRRARLGCIAALLSVASGCISASAGYRETRAIVKKRLDAALPSDDAKGDPSVRDLLAKPLTAENAARIAVLRNPEARAAFDRIGIARGDLVAALRLPNPSVEADLRFRGRSSDPDVGVGGTVDLREFVLIPLRARAATDDLDEASVEAASAILDVALRARIAYLDYVASRQTLELEGAVMAAVGASSELATALNAAGNTPELNALMQRSLYEKVKLDYAEAEADTAGARERVNLALGLTAGEANGWSAPERLADPPDEEIALADVGDKSVASSLELGALRARYSAAEGHERLALAEGAIPPLRVGVSAEKDPEGWGVGPRIGVGVPLFYQGEGAAMSARGEMKTTRDQALATEAQIRSMAKSLGVELTAARARATRYKTVILPLDEQVVAAAALQYNAMGISAFQLFQAKREEILAGEGYVASLRNYWRVRGEIEMLLAGHLPAAAPAPPPHVPLETGRLLGAPPD